MLPNCSCYWGWFSSYLLRVFFICIEFKMWPQNELVIMMADPPVGMACCSSFFQFFFIFLSFSNYYYSFRQFRCFGAEVYDLGTYWFYSNAHHEFMDLIKAISNQICMQWELPFHLSKPWSEGRPFLALPFIFFLLVVSLNYDWQNCNFLIEFLRIQCIFHVAGKCNVKCVVHSLNEMPFILTNHIHKILRRQIFDRSDFFYDFVLFLMVNDIFKIETRQQFTIVSFFCLASSIVC